MSWFLLSHSYVSCQHFVNGNTDVLMPFRSRKGRSTLAKCVPAGQGSKPSASESCRVRACLFSRSYFNFQPSQKRLITPSASLASVTLTQHPRRGEKVVTSGGNERILPEDLLEALVFVRGL